MLTDSHVMTETHEAPATPLAARARKPAITPTSDEVCRWIVRQVAASLKVAPEAVDVSAPLESLGIDSVEAFGITGALAEWLGRSLPATVLWDYASIQAVAEGLGDRAALKLSWPGVVSLQPLGNQTPVFFFPGQRGHPATFAPLAAALGTNQPCYGLTVPGLDGKQPPHEGMEAIAAAMVNNLLRVQPNGPYQLAGYSFGGLLAYEAARQLTSRHQTVTTLALFDTFTRTARPLRSCWNRLGLYGHLLLTQYARVAYVRERLARHRARAQAKARDRRREEADAPSASGAAAVEAANLRAVHRYAPGPYSGTIVLFRATDHTRQNVYYDVDPLGGWGDLAHGGVITVDLAGSHLTMLKDDHAVVAASQLEVFLGRSL